MIGKLMDIGSGVARQEAIMLDFGKALIVWGIALRNSCLTFNVNEEDVLSSSHERRFSRPRAYISYYMRKNTDLSLDQIGSLMGNREHSTIIAQMRNMDDEFFTDKRGDLPYRNFAVRCSAEFETIRPHFNEWKEKVHRTLEEVEGVPKLLDK